MVPHVSGIHAQRAGRVDVQAQIRSRGLFSLTAAGAFTHYGQQDDSLDVVEIASAGLFWGDRQQNTLLGPAIGAGSVTADGL